MGVSGTYRVCVLAFWLGLGAVFLPVPGSASAAQKADDGSELFLVAQKAFDDGFYDVATRYIEQFLQQFPASEKRVQAQLILGQCYFFSNQYLKAFDIFQKLLEYSEYKDATLFWLGETYFKGGDYKSAETYYRQLMDLYPSSEYLPQAYYSLGWTYYSQGQYKKAGATFAKMVEAFPAHQLTEDAVFKIGESAYNAADYPAAVKAFQDYIDRYPQSARHPEAYFYIAEAEHYSEDYLTAVTYYAKAAELAHDPKLVVMAKSGLGWSYLKLEKFALARKAFEEARAAAENKGIPTDEVLLGLASLYAQDGDPQKARDVYAALIAQFPDSPRLMDAQLGKANVDYVLKDYPAAVQGYAWVIEHARQAPDFLEKAYYGLAWTYLKAGDIDRSIQTFETIMNKTESKVVKVSALTQIGDAYQDVDQLEKALSVYDRILRDYPDSLYTDYVQFRQAVALLKLNRIEAATVSLQTLQKHFPNSHYLNETKYYLGLAYFKKEDWAQAVTYIEDYLRTDDSKGHLTAESQYILGLSQFNLKAYAKARDIFEAILRDYPDQPSIVRTADLNAAKSQYYMGEEAAALARLVGVKDKYPSTETAQDALMFLAQHALGHDDPASAVRLYTEFMNDFPGSEQLGQVYYELGQAYQMLNQPEKAVEQYRLSSQSADRNLASRAQLAIADIFSQTQEGENALSAYQKIADGAPEFRRDAYLKIARIYKDRKDYPEALHAYEQARTAQQGESPVGAAEIQFAEADLYELLHQNDQAVEAYLKIPYLYGDQTSWTAKSYLRAARIFEDAERWDEARKVYEKVAALAVDEAKYARERLDWIKENIQP